MDKRVILGAFVCIAFLGAAPQIRLGAGQANYPEHKYDMPFKGNYGFIEYTLNPRSRLQFGLKYENTETVLSRVRRLGVSGLLGTVKFYFNTQTPKTPYIGLNVGWLNTDVTQRHEYSARGAYSREYVAGYSFQLDNWQRVNMEYLHRTIEDALDYGERLKSEVLTLSWAITLDYVRPVRHQTQEEGLTTRQKYLQRRIDFNTEQIAKYDTLLTKYDQRILNETENESLRKEREYVAGQRAALVAENKAMLELLAK